MAKFEARALGWWDRESQFKPLHDINPLRVNWIDERVNLAGKKVLDVGCGGGILSEAMAQRGATVTGIDKLNDTMASMMGNYKISQSLQAANMIGHGVLVPGSKLALAKGAGLMGVELAKPADKVEVKIRDAAGNEVRTLDLGAQQAGSLPLTWDGKTNTGSAAADGSYTFEVSASQNGERVNTTALQFGLVGTVATGPNAKGVTLNIEGVGAVDFADVRQIL